MKKTVIITGGSDGLGYAIAKKLSPDNTVIILSPTEEKLKKAAQELKCDYEVCDISNNTQVETTISKIILKYKKLDCVVNNAALWIQGELDQNDPDYIKKVIDTNLTGVLFVTKAVVPQMKAQKEGLIININSQAGITSKAERSVYHAAKWGLTGLTKSLQAELTKYGIRVTGIYPGKLSTHMFIKMGIQKEMNDALDTEEVARTVEFILNSKPTTFFPEIGIKVINN
jgi:NADP-dependent 3-hydroxy acid dehydrogenase YdfG